MKHADKPPERSALAKALAARLRESRTVLAQHWLERITARVTLPRDRVFPTKDLLDHVPLLLGEIADYLENPAEDVEGDTPVLAEAVELGELRHAQGFDAYELLKEYEVLGSILFHFLSEAATELPTPADPSEMLTTSKHLFRAIEIIQQTTMSHFLRLADERVAEREDRLRAFNRMISHEIRNNIGAILGAADLLSSLPKEDTEQRRKFTEIIQRKARSVSVTVNNLAALSHLDGKSREHRHVRLPQAAAEAVRQLRDAAAAAKVDVRIAPDIADVEVNAPVVELALGNYLSNAIKYARRDDGTARVEVTANEAKTGEQDEAIVCVADNGDGVPPEKRGGLFERFFRAHDNRTPVEGSGLGLSIVRETVEAAGGRAWAEFPDGGSKFFVALPIIHSISSTNRSSHRR